MVLRPQERRQIGGAANERHEILAAFAWDKRRIGAFEEFSTLGKCYVCLAYYKISWAKSVYELRNTWSPYYHKLLG